MYTFIPDYGQTRSRLDERLKRAELERRAHEVRRARRTRSFETVTVPAPERRQVSGTMGFRVGVAE